MPKHKEPALIGGLSYVKLNRSKNELVVTKKVCKSATIKL